MMGCTSGVLGGRLDLYPDTKPLETRLIGTADWIGLPGILGGSRKGGRLWCLGLSREERADTKTAKRKSHDYTIILGKEVIHARTRIHRIFISDQLWDGCGVVYLAGAQLH